MAEKSGSKTASGKLPRNVAVTVRLDPRLRYLAEIAARRQRRTVSSFVEWAIEQSLERIQLNNPGGEVRTLADEANNLWSTDQVERFVMLGYCYPELQTHEEQLVWNLISTNGKLWLDTQDSSRVPGIDIELLRQHWNLLNSVALGEADESDLDKALEASDA
jgi:hypothetical protein